jgi:hypothetical protein
VGAALAVAVAVVVGVELLLLLHPAIKTAAARAKGMVALMVVIAQFAGSARARTTLGSLALEQGGHV